MAKKIRTLIPAPSNTCYNSLLLFGNNFVEKIAWRVLKMAFKYENFLVGVGGGHPHSHTSPMIIIYGDDWVAWIIENNFWFFPNITVVVLCQNLY